MFYLDPSIYGLPNVGYEITETDPFRASKHNSVGRGLYKSYNPTGPVSLSVSWDWPASVYREFRLAWDDVDQLRFGGAWFTADFPLGLTGEDIAGDESSVEVRQPFTIEVGTDGTDYGYSSVGTVYGDRTPRYIANDPNGVASLRTAGQNTFRFRQYSSVKVEGQDSVGLIIPEFSDGRVWNMGYGVGAGPDAYETTETMTGIVNWINGLVGQTVSLAIVYNRPRMQEYACHFQAPYSAEPIGFGDYYRVSARLDVDRSPRLPQLTG